MPIIRDETVETVWKRSPDAVAWQIVPVTTADGEIVYELHVRCGHEAHTMGVFDAQEMRNLAEAIRSEVP